jgi:hypothetical protein
MKNAISAVVIALFATLANAQDTVKYRLEIGKDAVEVQTFVGSHGNAQKLTTEAVVTEVNSERGVVSNVMGQRQTGVVAEIASTDIAADGRVLTTVGFTAWNKGVQTAKGTHVVAIARGETLSLPSAGERVAVTLLK